MATQIRSRKSTKESASILKPNSSKSDLDSTSSQRSGTSVSSSDESKSELEPALKERKRRISKKVACVLPAGHLTAIPWGVLVGAFWILDVFRNAVRVFWPDMFVFVDGSIMAAFMHIAYSIIVPVCFYQLWEKSPRRVSSSLMVPVIAVFTVASSVQVVTECAMTKLTIHGFDSELSVEENTLMQFVKPRELVDVFADIVYIGNGVGHFLWWTSFLLFVLLYFLGCFIKKASKIPEGIQQLTTPCWVILLLLAIYMWYIVAQNAIVWPFLLVVVVALVYQMFEFSMHRITDINGQLLLQSLGVALVFLATWKFLLWGDKDLDKMYPGFLEVPQPWMYVKMYVCNSNNNGLKAIMEQSAETTVSTGSPVLSVT